VQKVRGGGGDQRHRGGALVSGETPHGGDRHRDPRDDQGDEERERGDAAVREVLQRDAVRLEDVACVGPEALPRDLERPGSRAVGRVLREHVPRLAPPAPAVVDVQRADAAGVVLHLGARARRDVLVEPRHRVADGDGDACDPRCHDDPRRDEQDHAHSPPVFGRQRAARADRDEGRDERGAGEREEAEDRAVGDAVRALGAVLDEGRPRERPPRDERRRTRGRCEEEAAAESLRRQQEPEQEDDHGSHHSGP
jgi:hypothetical protein